MQGDGLAPHPANGPAPLVSVIMPAWNAFPYIHEAVNSVLSQSLSDLELIVVNDGSTDGDYTLLTQIDSRVRLIEGQRGGVSRARNLAMAAARGIYLAFIDADDIWVPGKLAVQVEFLQRRPDVAVVYGSIARWWPDADGTYPSAEGFFPDMEELRMTDDASCGWAYLSILMGSPLGMITPVMRRSLYEQVGGFNEDLSRGEDYDFWLRCSRLGRMQGFTAVMALYRMRADSAMHQTVRDNYLARLLESARDRWGLSDPDGRTVPAYAFRWRVGRTHFDHGYRHYWSGDPVVAADAFRKSLLHGYRPLKSVAYLGMSWFKRLRGSRQHGH